MANLELIKRLNDHYGKRSPITNERRFFALNESLDPTRLQKAITDSLADLGPTFTHYFDLGLPADVVMLYIDVCDFSTRFARLNGEEIGEYFDEYYDLVIPIIYKYGGEIDKIMGDGIICIFGPPFQNLGLSQNISKADNCAREVVKATKGSKFASKVAMHSGTINYFKNKTGLYKEFTIIGKPLTELFRLESISINDRINYFESTDVEDYYESLVSLTSSGSARWTQYQKEIEHLKGVHFKSFYSLKYNF